MVTSKETDGLRELTDHGTRFFNDLERRLKSHANWKGILTAHPVLAGLCSDESPERNQALRQLQQWMKRTLHTLWERKGGGSCPLLVPLLAQLLPWSSLASNLKCRISH